MRIVFALPLIAPLLLAGCMGQGRDTASAETTAGLDKALVGLTPGKATSCIPVRLSQVSTKSYGDVLLYKYTNGDVYRNDTSGGCNNRAGDDDVFVQIETQGRPCSGDIVRTVDRYTHMPTGSCALREFTPYLKMRK